MTMINRIGDILTHLIYGKPVKNEVGKLRWCTFMKLQALQQKNPPNALYKFRVSFRVYI